MFTGFTTETQKFLRELDSNNNREWFSENKSRYDAFIMQPALEFIAAMEKPLHRISPFFTSVAKRTGGSLMRVYRDTRFSKDKTPYKPYVGIHFRHQAGKDAHAPGFYFHIDKKSVFVGGGIWQPEPSVLEQIRFLIDDQPNRWKKIVRSKTLNGAFTFSGTTLKRPPKGYEASHPLIEDLKRKDHFIEANLTTADLTSPKLVDATIERFKLALPFMRFLCDSIKLPA
jgi:uncharacterized protein (TIGR02453 family)